MPIVDHKWDNGLITKEATCKETGEITYTCEFCGVTKDDKVAKSNHKPEHIAAIPAVKAECEKAGKTAGRRDRAHRRIALRHFSLCGLPLLLGTARLRH